MKKIYRKSTVHPSPPPVSDQLAFLPAAILTLAAALSFEDREVLAYLLSPCSVSFSGNRKTEKTGGVHPASFNCSCFMCYTSYWVRWDSSPNRQLIHEIIDFYEDGSLIKGSSKKNKREKRSKKGTKFAGEMSSEAGELAESESVESEVVGNGEDVGCGDGEGEDKGGLKKFVSFIGERIWSVWI